MDRSPAALPFELCDAVFKKWACAMPERLPVFKPPWIPRSKAAEKKREAARPNATQRGYTSRGWQLTRQEVLQRDMHQCQLCGKIVTGKDAHVDHIVRKKITGSNHVSGLQTLCASCHSRKTCQETNVHPTPPIGGRTPEATQTTKTSKTAKS